jgi:hypothetical protein
MHVLLWRFQRTANKSPALFLHSMPVEPISADFVQGDASVSKVRKKKAKQLKQTEKGSNFTGARRA